MASARIKVYPSPTMVLLAFDWADGGTRDDFLGFAISRTPGFQGEATSWLPNRIDFNGPAPEGSDYPSNTAPIQKFMWWDARINTADHGKLLTYVVTPIVGTPGHLEFLDNSHGSVDVTIPKPVEQGIGTYFNRAVVSSQAFVRRFTQHPEGNQVRAALAWLANGLETVIPTFLSGSAAVDGAIYHLTDDVWVIPALLDYLGLEFPTKSGQGVKDYSVCSYSAGETYPSDECRRLLL